MHFAGQWRHIENCKLKHSLRAIGSPILLLVMGIVAGVESAGIKLSVCGGKTNEPCR